MPDLELILKAVELAIGGIGGELAFYKYDKVNAWQRCEGLGAITCVRIGRFGSLTCCVALTGEGRCYVFTFMPSPPTGSTTTPARAGTPPMHRFPDNSPTTHARTQGDRLRSGPIPVLHHPMAHRRVASTDFLTTSTEEAEAARIERKVSPPPHVSSPKMAPKQSFGSQSTSSIRDSGGQPRSSINTSQGVPFVVPPSSTPPIPVPQDEWPAETMTPSHIFDIIHNTTTGILFELGRICVVVNFSRGELFRFNRWYIASPNLSVPPCPYGKNFYPEAHSDVVC